MADSPTAIMVAKGLDRARLARIADALAVAVTISLPWSTSATVILVVVWLVAVLPTLDLAAVRRELASPAGALPVLLCLLGVLGVLWAGVSLKERLGGLDSFMKLLAIPVLFAQFRRSDNGHWVLTSFLASTTALLILSWADWLWLSDTPLGQIPGVPVKDYMSQAGMFQICIFCLAYAGVDAWRSGRHGFAVALAALAFVFLANIVYVISARTVLVLMPVLLVLLAVRQFSLKGTIGVVLAGAVLASIFWISSPLLRARLSGLLVEVERYRVENVYTSSGARLEFWKKSIGFVAQAPLIGHGTGSINELFRHSAAGESGAAAIASHNPHQQILAVAIQLGLIGVAMLVAMWAAHVALFRRAGFVPWIGLVVVVQNVLGSLFNTHLFDFTQGWLYVFGVGVIGGMVLREKISTAAPLQSTAASAQQT